MGSIFVYPIFAAVVFGLVYQHYSSKKNRLGLPPGPKPWPIVGNLFDLPPHGKPEYEHWLKFSEEYGPISSLTIFGKTMVILQDYEAAHELLTKKATKSASRPGLTFANELCGLEGVLTNQSYNEGFKHQRKLVHQQVGTKTLVRQFADLQDLETRRFLYRIINEPDDILKHIKTTTASIVLKFTYGYTLSPFTTDPLLTLIGEMMTVLSIAIVPLSWMVDVVPGLKHIPDWFPGASFKQVARKCKRTADMTKEIPYEFVLRKMASGDHYPSYVSNLVTQYSTSDVEKGSPRLSKADEEAIKDTASVIYAGAAETTASTIYAFVLAMVMFPKVQEKAQKELDEVVGFGNLPQFEHREKLPYINAIVKEALRWFPILPVGATHATREELTVAGYRIPAGSYLIPAIWWFQHDPSTHPNPMDFEPERFLPPRNEADPASDVFGYGLRLCPGRFLADDNLFLVMARLLAVFTLSRGLDDQKREIVPELKSIPGVIDCPESFAYRIRPRSEEHVRLIKSVVEEHPWDDSDALFMREFSGLA